MHTNVGSSIQLKQNRDSNAQRRLKTKGMLAYYLTPRITRITWLSSQIYAKSALGKKLQSDVSHTRHKYTYHNLFGSPRIQIHRSHFADVYAKIAMNAGTSYAQEYSQVPRCPSRT